MKKLLVLMTLYGCGSDSGVTSVPVLPTPTTTPLKGENDDKTTSVVASEITAKASDKTGTSAVVAEKEKNSGKTDDVDSDAPASTQSSSSSSLKLTDPSCVDPDLTKVSITERFMNCRGEFVNGTMEDPTPTPAVTITPPGPTQVITVQVPTPAPIPSFLLWTIIAIGAILVIALVILIVRTRRIS